MNYESYVDASEMVVFDYKLKWSMTEVDENLFYFFSNFLLKADYIKFSHKKSLHEHCYVVSSMHYRIISLAMFTFLAATVSATTDCPEYCSPGLKVNNCCSGKLISHTHTIYFLSIDDRIPLRGGPVRCWPCLCKMHSGSVACVILTVTFESHCMVCPTTSSFSFKFSTFLNSHPWHRYTRELKLNLEIYLGTKHRFVYPELNPPLSPPPSPSFSLNITYQYRSSLYEQVGQFL